MVIQIKIIFLLITEDLPKRLKGLYVEIQQRLRNKSVTSIKIQLIF